METQITDFSAHFLFLCIYFSSTNFPPSASLAGAFTFWSVFFIIIQLKIVSNLLVIYKGVA